MKCFNSRSLKSIWAIACKDRYFFYELMFSLFILVIVMLVFSRFTAFVEMRNGVQFRDPFLSLFSAVDLTWPIFSVIYGAILLGLFILLYYPGRLVLLFEAYAVMVIFRILMMYLTPLNTPEGMIYLEDPFVSLFVTGKTLTRDLFFSGHTATMFLLLLFVPKKYKIYFFLFTVLVASGVLLQKVHYTVDVVVAPFVSFTAYFFITRFFLYRRKIDKLESRR